MRDSHPSDTFRPILEAISNARGVNYTPDELTRYTYSVDSTANPEDFVSETSKQAIELNVPVDTDSVGDIQEIIGSIEVGLKSAAVGLDEEWYEISEDRRAGRLQIRIDPGFTAAS